MSPKTMTATNETNAVKARMRMSGWTSKCMAEVERDIMFATALLPQKATTAAKPPPPAASNTLSVKWLAKDPRPPSTECKSQCYCALAEDAARRHPVRHLRGGADREPTN